MAWARNINRYLARSTVLLAAVVLCFGRVGDTPAQPDDAAIDTFADIAEETADDGLTTEVVDRPLDDPCSRHAEELRCEYFALEQETAALLAEQGARLREATKRIDALSKQMSDFTSSMAMVTSAIRLQARVIIGMASNQAVMARLNDAHAGHVDGALLNLRRQDSLMDVRIDEWAASIEWQLARATVMGAAAATLGLILLAMQHATGVSMKRKNGASTRTSRSPARGHRDPGETALAGQPGSITTDSESNASVRDRSWDTGAKQDKVDSDPLLVPQDTPGLGCRGLLDSRRPPWSVGIASDIGRVRQRNEDCGVAFTMDEHSVVVIADGVGGTPHGKEAACLAVASAATSLTRSLTSRNEREALLSDICRLAVQDAANALAVEGFTRGLSAVHHGLRTTLIAVVARGSKAGFAYIGDGGIVRISTARQVQSFLKPHRRDPPASNVLAASLGPVTHGLPTAGTIERDPGDLLLVGTDGVFDDTHEGLFPCAVLDEAVKQKGDLSATAKTIVEQMAAYDEGGGPFFSDNLTLGLIGNGAPELEAEPPATDAVKPPPCESASPGDRE